MIDSSRERVGNGTEEQENVKRILVGRKTIMISLIANHVFYSDGWHFCFKTNREVKELVFLVCFWFSVVNKNYCVSFLCYKKV